MFTIRVPSNQVQPPAKPMATEFDETGGTIGRAPNNQLVLPEPERHISRVQASVAFRNGQYVIMDQGSANPIQINGRALGNGVQAPLVDGDEVRIGDDALWVAVPAALPKGADALFREPLSVSAIVCRRRTPKSPPAPSAEPVVVHEPGA
jgi:predicted component of type VI protein secretion system